ncbi:MAG TPA: hypothetical protein VFW31_09760 [Candidatus Angelobacter sp.]|nr:hypothetical protein [Candidatus Angelobacter sp.]
MLLRIDAAQNRATADPLCGRYVHRQRGRAMRIPNGARISSDAQALKPALSRKDIATIRGAPTRMATFLAIRPFTRNLLVFLPAVPTVQPFQL